MKYVEIQMSIELVKGKTVWRKSENNGSNSGNNINIKTSDFAHQRVHVQGACNIQKKCIFSIIRDMTT
jgi:hypothetical protein